VAAVDPETGVATITDRTAPAAGEPVTANPTELAATRAGDRTTFGALAALELVALVMLPGLYVSWRRRAVARKADAA
jgi:hypothetical protein